MGKRLKQMVSKEDIQMSKKHMKDNQISNYQRNAYQTTMRFHLTPVRMTIIRPINTGEDVEKREPSNTVGGNVNWSSHYGEQYGGFSKN